MSTGRIILGVFLILLGLSILVDFPILQYAFALLIVIIGIRVLTGKSIGWKGGDRAHITHEDTINEVAIFGPLDKVISSKDFRGGKLTAVFGGGDVDLREAQTTATEIELEITAVFGGIDIRFPKHWRVESNGVAILGGYSNKTQGDGSVTVRVKGTAAFGGVELRN
jgi:predicted membrane protein